RLPKHLEGLEGLIIPGGESTTIAKLAYSSGLMGPLKEFALKKPVWGVCAGMIFIAKNIGSEQPTLGLMDIVVERNAFGRQIDSFVTDIHVSVFANGDKKPFKAVFIRAPRLIETKGQARVIARLPSGEAVAAQEGIWLATSFHPELTADNRFHEFFLETILLTSQKVRVDLS
ncbi:MAG: pyridoxal 5'-phosphate synthase glutaminase subunit PdxT, partial [Desulfobacterales bacterium]|nr:pyridoxal 5'-phosphate synthase glutaminase subunit PdxT [Desulfobacterales bacterium]